MAKVINVVTGDGDGAITWHIRADFALRCKLVDLLSPQTGATGLTVVTQKLGTIAKELVEKHVVGWSKGDFTPEAVEDEPLSTLMALATNTVAELEGTARKN